MQERKLEGLIKPVVEALGYEYVGLEYHRHPTNGVVRLYIDTPEQGVGLEDCERVSQEVAALLDVEDPIKGHYHLEVSSPGVDRPLFTLEHYRRFTGEEAKLTVLAPIEGRRRFKGIIAGVEDDAVKLLQDGEAVMIPLAAITKARLVPDFDRLMKSGSA